MHRASIVASLAIVTLAVAAAGAHAQAVYRSVGPDGRITYSDAPPPSGTDAKRIEMQAAPPAASDPGRDRARRADEQRQVDGFLQRGREQSAALDRARSELVTAQKELDAARQRVKDGAEPQPGERVGTAGGTSRLGEAYFDRQKQLERAVQDAEARLSRAQQQVNNLR